MRYIFLLLTICGAAAAAMTMRCCTLEDEVSRHRRNAAALGDSLIHYRTRLGEAAASAAVLELRCDEFRRLHAEDAERIRSLGLRLRRLESHSTVAAATQTEVVTVLHDTVTLRDTLRRFEWSDGHVSAAGEIRGDSVSCRIESIDTLRQIVHRIPHRFLFIRYGTKALRQEIVSSNPHTTIICAEYIEFTPRRRGKVR